MKTGLIDERTLRVELLATKQFVKQVGKRKTVDLLRDQGECMLSRAGFTDEIDVSAPEDADASGEPAIRIYMTGRMHADPQEAQEDAAG